jgi:hypothetical protein
LITVDHVVSIDSSSADAVFGIIPTFGVNAGRFVAAVSEGAAHSLVSIYLKSVDASFSKVVARSFVSRFPLLFFGINLMRFGFLGVIAPWIGTFQ